MYQLQMYQLHGQQQQFPWMHSYIYGSRLGHIVAKMQKYSCKCSGEDTTSQNNFMTLMEQYLGSAPWAAALLSTPSWKFWILFVTKECRKCAGVWFKVMPGMLVGKAHCTHCMITSRVSFLNNATKNAACPFACTTSSAYLSHAYIRRVQCSAAGVP